MHTVRVFHIHSHSDSSDLPVVGASSSSPQSFARMLQAVWPSGLELTNLNMAGRICDAIRVGYLFSYKTTCVSILATTLL